ncbi:hypothetical protein FVE85_1786 [Porphyridium purpureum]|uniref:Uncharacterized protein n=1 Tax=Porphyridium purpureum TaxID=35688 RepID=A0A5J4YVV2_PORPP|nr:hypothetical protein FVE85_1786 [Porphyridium purpureum]|eukprot:POR8333..scf209_3
MVLGECAAETRTLDRMRERLAWLPSLRATHVVAVCVVGLLSVAVTVWRTFPFASTAAEYDMELLAYTAQSRSPGSNQSWYAPKPGSSLDDAFGANEPFDVMRNTRNGDGGAAISRLLAMISAWEAARGTKLQDEDLFCVHSLLFKERIPFALMQAFSDAERRRLCSVILERKRSLMWQNDAVSVLFAQPDFGLGNRLRALAALLAHASATGKLLVVLWTKNQHLNASFYDLFAAGHQALVIHDFDPGTYPWCTEDKDPNCVLLDELNFIFAENPDRIHPEKFDWQKEDKRAAKAGKLHFFVKTAYVLRSSHNHAVEELRVDAVGVFLRRLRPNQAVYRLVDAALKALPVPIKNTVGVHVRSLAPEAEFETSRGENMSSAELEALRMNQKALYGERGYEILGSWRSATGPQAFTRHLASLDASVHFFVASDSESAYEALSNAFPNRVHRASGGTTCGRPRDCACVQFAFTDIILLGHTAQLFGSGYSSFSEVAKRRGDIPMQLAGKHF